MSFDPIANGWRKLLKNGGVGYTESGKTIFSVKLTAVAGGEGSMYQNIEKLVLVDGRKYIVQTDSGTFESKCTYHPPIEGDNESYWTLGDSSLFNSVLGTTDDPFAVMVATDGEQWLVVCADKNGGTHMTISEAETVHTIDPKYISGVTLPFVEITSAEYPIGTGAVTLSADEAAQFDRATATGLPAVIKCNFAGAPVVGTSVVSMGAYMIPVGDGMLMFTSNGNGGWQMGS